MLFYPTPIRHLLKFKLEVGLTVNKNFPALCIIGPTTTGRFRPCNLSVTFALFKASFLFHSVLDLAVNGLFLTCSESVIHKMSSVERLYVQEMDCRLIHHYL